MRHDRDGGNRTNWLLIKHRDEFAREGEANQILDEDRSIASGRTMAEIAAGKGRAPKPFMLAKAGRGKADAVWDSNEGSAAEARADRNAISIRASARAGQARARKSPRCRISSRRSSAPWSSVRRTREGWCHEIKFDGYRVQLRVEGGKATLKTRKGLDWTDKFEAIAKAGSALPDVLIDGEIVALDHNGVPDFSTLQAAISDGKTDNLIFFAFDLLFAGGEDLRSAAARRAQGAA